MHMQYNILIQGKDFSDCPIAQALVKIPYWVTQKLPQINTATHLPNTDTKNLSTNLGLFLEKQILGPTPPPPRGALGATQKFPHPKKKKKKKNPFFFFFR